MDSREGHPARTSRAAGQGLNVADEPLSNDPVVNDDGTVPPLSTGGIRRGLMLIVGFVMASWGLYQKLKTDPKSVTSMDIEMLVTNFALASSAAVSLYVGIRTILKRIEVGKDPANPAPPIALPGPLQRLTR